MSTARAPPIWGWRSTPWHPAWACRRGDEISQYKEGDEQFSVKLRLDRQRNDPKRMGELLIPSLPWER